MFKKIYLFVASLFILNLTFLQEISFAQSELSSLEIKIQELKNIVSQLQTQVQQMRSSFKEAIFLGPPLREENGGNSLREKGGKNFDFSTLETPSVEIVAPYSRNNQLCYNFRFNLSLGSRGEAVLALQKILEAEGFNVGEEKERGIFGKLTALAVSGFQEKYRKEILDPLGIKNPTGIVGNLTRAKLNSLYGCELTSPGIPPKVLPSEVGGVTSSQPSLEKGMKRKFTGLLKAADPSVYMWGTHVLSVQEEVVCVKAPCLPVPVFYYVKPVNDNVLEKIKRLENQQVVIEGYLEYVKLEGRFNGIVAYEIEPYLKPSLPVYSYLTVTSPNGGENWEKETLRKIEWRSDDSLLAPCPPERKESCPPPPPRYWNISLIPYSSPCVAGSSCPMNSVTPYTIVKELKLVGSLYFSYDWLVGRVVGYDGSNAIVPDGLYKVQVCEIERGNQCDSSDNYFRITSTKKDDANNKPPVTDEIKNQAANVLESARFLLLEILEKIR